MKKIDISDFQRDHEFYGTLDLLLTVKSFDLQAIRKRYLASKKNNRAGSVERRAVALGGVVALQLAAGKLIAEEVLAEVKEPRGIDFHDGNLAVSSENKAYIVNDTLSCIQNDWFSYIHTVEFSPYDSDKLLISSSGFDCVFEYNWKTAEMLWEWFAWEHGWNKGKEPATGEPLYLTRRAEQAKEWEKEGLPHLLIHKPLEQVLPTAKRAAFINSVSYHQSQEGVLMATLFHKGAVAEISQDSGDLSLCLEGLNNPHGGWQKEGQLLATSTASGEVVLKREEECRYQFNQLSDKPIELGEMEWLQNSKQVGDFIVTIDSNRTAMVIFHPEKKLYDMIPYNDNWAVQDMVVGQLTDAQKKLLKTL
jgi:hypothetical protein